MLLNFPVIILAFSQLWQIEMTPVMTPVMTTAMTTAMATAMITAAITAAITAMTTAMTTAKTTAMTTAVITAMPSVSGGSVALVEEDSVGSHDGESDSGLGVLSS